MNTSILKGKGEQSRLDWQSNELPTERRQRVQESEGLWSYP